MEHSFTGNTAMETVLTDKALYISVAEDFSRTPGPRREIQGKFSGEVFRDTILLPKLRKAIENHQKLIVDLDYTAGYASSFLEEAFGGLVRLGLTRNELLEHLEIKSDHEPFWIDDILNEFIPNGKNPNY
jgi:hypothetical protein